MRTLVVSDLHSNHDALSAVMKRIHRKRFDRIVCLGDFVGYGAQPNQVLDAMRKFRTEKHFIRGNHDRVASGADRGEGFNYAALSAILWTRERLSGPNRRFLEGLKVGPVAVDGKTLICHGSPFDEDEYIFGDHHAAAIFQHYDFPVILYGHTHLPAIFALEEDQSITTHYIRGSGTFKLEPTKRYLINPGSVGQPRDRNPMASFAILDDERRSIQFIRVEYDLAKAQAAVLQAGLPRILADRLAFGT